MTDSPLTLDELSLAGVARYIQSNKCKRVFVMVRGKVSDWKSSLSLISSFLKTGAGISTSAGIPDFRSPDTGIYVNLARLNLPYPEAVFDIRFFRTNPLPFYTLAHELAPGRFRPTVAHSFIRLLHEKKLLHTCFTQNIDTLERRAGLPEDKIVEAHGSFASHHCIDCMSSFDNDKMKLIMRKKEVPKCEHCSGLVKPDIVFFGEALPSSFHRSIRNLPTADLLLILGTSLTVHPFASLTEFVPKSCPRVLINLDAVGDIGSRADDVIVLGKCDEIVRRLSKLLGWEEELGELWRSTEDSVDREDDEEEARCSATTVEEEVQKLTDEVEKSLKLASELKQATRAITTKQEDAAASAGATVDPSPTNKKAEDTEAESRAEGVQGTTIGPESAESERDKDCGDKAGN